MAESPLLPPPPRLPLFKPDGFDFVTQTEGDTERQTDGSDGGRGRKKRGAGGRAKKKKGGERYGVSVRVRGEVGVRRETCWQISLVPGSGLCNEPSSHQLLHPLWLLLTGGPRLLETTAGAAARVT